MLHAEEGNEFHARRALEHLHRALALAVDAGAVREQPHALALQEGEILLFEHIDAEHHGVDGGELAGGRRTPQRAIDRDGRHDRRSGRGARRWLARTAHHAHQRKKHQGQQLG